MPTNARILSGQAVSEERRTLVFTSMRLTLSKDVTTTGPDRRTYPKGSAGWVKKCYRGGVILEMDDKRKIPVSFDFLEVSFNTRMPVPYESPL